MDFRIDATLPASASQLWAIFFDVRRVAALIPGCENVTEVEPLKSFSAVMKQKIGPFKLEMPTTIVVTSYSLEREVALTATGRDKFTGTSIDVRMKVSLSESGTADDVACLLAVEAEMQVAGRLASLGYPVVKKKSEELFAEFEKRLRNELSGLSGNPQTPAPQAAAATESPAASASHSGRTAPPLPTAAALAEARESTAVPNAGSALDRDPTGPRSHRAERPARNVELVLQWPRVGVSVAVACVVAFAATTAFQQSPGWWIVAPLLGVAAGLGRRQE